MNYVQESDQQRARRNLFVVALRQFEGKTDVLEFVNHKKRSEKMNIEYQLKIEVKGKKTLAIVLKGDAAEISKERRKFSRYPSAINSRNQEKHQDHI